ncbi:MAG: hypothetical protein ABIL58_03150 [Pseudomonadota bacterium]
MLPKRQPSQAPADCRGLSPWLRLGFSMAVLFFVVTVLGPLGLRLPGYRQMGRFIAENNLKATAIYYTDLEEFARSESMLRDGFSFAPADRFSDRQDDRP